MATAYVGRSCGGCTVCCNVAAIPELGKAAHTPCLHVGANGCLIYDKIRPDVCTSFQCTWSRGFGDGNARPDKIALFTAISELGGKAWPVVIEVADGALMQPRAAKFVCTVVEVTELPAIVVDYGSMPPGDIGDRVVVAKFMHKQTKRMRGDFLAHLGDGTQFGIYELKAG